MSLQPVIAVVEDDAEIRTLVCDYLAREHFDARACRDGSELDRLMEASDIDLVVLDLMMPGEDGLTICRRIGETRGTPILILSAKGEDIDRIVGLEVGADDYMAKPFNPRELVARIRAVLRRRRSIAEPLSAPEDGNRREIYRFEGWQLDADAHALTDPDGEPVPLSGGEFSLLLAFARHPRRVLTRDQLLDWTRGPDSEAYDRAVDVQLSRLRRKLGDDPRAPRLIRTVRGDGYLFTAEVRRERQP